MRVGRVWITLEALEKAINLHHECKIHAVAPPDADDITNRRFTLLIEGPQMPEHWEGNVTELVSVPQEE